MDKTFKLGLIIGRFQHIHLGHTRMIDTALATCEQVLLLVGSSQESLTERNPFNLKTRMDLIRSVYWDDIVEGTLLLGHIDDMTHENDVSLEWGDFVLQKVDMWSQHYGLSCMPDCMIYGNDEERMSWFRSESVEYMSQIKIARNTPISATLMREYLMKNKYSDWSLSVPEPIRNRAMFNRLGQELLEIPYYKEMIM